MESLDAETGMVDCGVGTIVWVRRRNGSWWPGKILGPNELSASHLMSPRSGTPVKLLGREDASVDWYNLEKSKRVKPFRCGEFDDCIERAEASQGMPPKKREKYARREDAILHALELEKELLEKKHGKSVPSNGMSTELMAGVEKDATAPTEFSCDNGKYVNSKMDDKQKGPSLQQAQRVDSGCELGVDDKSSDVRPRMRGLQDLGLSPVSLKYKFPSLATSNGYHEHAPDDGIRADLDSRSPENLAPVSGGNLLEKRKRSHEGHMQESLSKRRDRRRPLVQVLENSAKIPLVHSLQLHDEGGSAPHPVSGKEQREVLDPTKEGTLNSEDRFDCDGTLRDHVEVSTSNIEGKDDALPVGLSEENTTGSAEDTETDSSGTESLVSDTCDAITALSDEAEHIELIPKSFGRSEAPGEEDDSESDDDSGESLPTSASVSKWQLKGKRNRRSLTNRYADLSDGKVSHWTSFKGVRGYGARGFDSINWEELTRNDEDCLKGYWEQSVEYHDGGRMLIDVEVQVQSGYQREHVPMISLMSKLNEKAIVGHPIPIETLADDTTLQPWRTARRSRVARPPHLSSRKWPKKPQRRSGLSCSQKIRRLSSIGGPQQQQEEEEEEDGLGVMKPVACIPVKLVFSRLHEELVARQCHQ